MFEVKYIYEYVFASYPDTKPEKNIVRKIKDLHYIALHYFCGDIVLIFLKLQPQMEASG
jgi:hypothetical protein